MAIFFILSAELTGIVSSLFMGDSIATWFSVLEKPFFSPPNWIFGPVWTLLYALMGIAAYIIWKHRREHRRSHLALRLYWAQLLFNFLWSIIFFNMHQIGLAFIDIVILLVLIVLTTVYFFKANKTAGWLMIPYIAWVSFATALNLSLYVLN